MVQIIKETVKKMIAAERLTDIIIAKVVSVNPIKLQISQNYILPEDFIVVPEKLTNHFIYLTSVDDNFNDIEDESKYKMRKKYIVYNALKVNDNVIIARKPGGQKYFIIDRLTFKS